MQQPERFFSVSHRQTGTFVFCHDLTRAGSPTTPVYSIEVSDDGVVLHPLSMPQVDGFSRTMIKSIPSLVSSCQDKWPVNELLVRLARVLTHSSVTLVLNPADSSDRRPS